METMTDEESAVANRLRNQQQALAEFGLFAFRATELDAILQRATELVAEGLDVQLTKVLELLPGGDRFLVRAGVNWRPGVVGHVTVGADHESPAGFALLCDAPVVSSDTDRETRFRIPEVLREHGVRSMVNVPIVGAGHSFGVLEVDTPEKRNFSDDDIAFLLTCANLLAAAVDRHRAHDALEAVSREQKVLIQELQHRVKNMLGLVQAITQQTTADGEEARAFQEGVVGRLQALAHAENLVFEDHAQELDLRRLVERSVEPFRRGGGTVRVEGEPLNLPARSGRIIALVLHELATNATKYGALSGSGGEVRISWTSEPTQRGRHVRFRWTESGGPAVVPPQRSGFGTRLLTALAGYELDGEAKLEHPPAGLDYQLGFTTEAD